jgi:hypothetical protein
MSCDVGPGDAPDELREWARQDRSARRGLVRSEQRDGLHVTLYVTTLGAYLTDTLRAVVAELPRLDQHAIVDRDPPCGGWSAYSPNATGELFVIKGDPNDIDLDLTPVSKTAPPDPRGSPMRCRP